MGEVVEMPFAFWFDVNEEELEKRILERSKTSGRNDDNAETLRKRFAQFKTEQIPIINKYAEMGKIRKIDGARPVEVVYAEVKQALAGYIWVRSRIIKTLLLIKLSRRALDSKASLVKPFLRSYVAQINFWQAFFFILLVGHCAFLWLLGSLATSWCCPSDRSGALVLGLVLNGLNH